METMNEALERICTPQFYDQSGQDMKLVIEQLDAARAGGRPIDNLLVESIAEKRLEQARGYSRPEGAPGATLESSRYIVNQIVAMDLEVQFALEASQQT